MPIVVELPGLVAELPVAVARRLYHLVCHPCTYVPCIMLGELLASGGTLATLAIHVHFFEHRSVDPTRENRDGVHSIVHACMRYGKQILGVT